MRTKRIKQNIKAKFDDFLKSIDDQEVRNLVEKNTVMSGGCIASMLLGENVNDYDMYFRNERTAIAVARYYCKKFNVEGVFDKAYVRYDNIIEQPEMTQEDKDKIIDWTNGWDTLDDKPQGRIKIFVSGDGIAEGEEPPETGSVVEQVSEADEFAATDLEEVQIQGEVEPNKKKKEKPAPYRPVFMSSNAITLSGQVQLILRFCGSPQDIHDNYDFVHCMNSWTSWDNHLELKLEALESLINKELEYHGSRYPLCSLFRLRKFLGRGWSVNAGQILKIGLQVSELDLTDMAVLEDQLIGVDTAYFCQLIDIIKDKQTKDGINSVDRNYIISVVDKIF